MHLGKSTRSFALAILLIGVSSFSRAQSHYIDAADSIKWIDYLNLNTSRGAFLSGREWKELLSKERRLRKGTDTLNLKVPELQKDTVIETKQKKGNKRKTKINQRFRRSSLQAPDTLLQNSIWARILDHTAGQ